MKLAGKIALVTGAGRRVGRAIADALSREGTRTAIHYNESRAGADELHREITSRGGEAEVFRADLTDAGAAEELIGAVVARFGRLDILVNSAAVMVRTPFGEVTAQDWDAMFALNLRAPFFLSQAAARAMGWRGSGEKKGGGAIINIADLAAYESWVGYVPHGISKAGIVRMTKSLAKVLGPTIRVNAVAPGAVLLPEGFSESDAAHLAETSPLRRLGEPADVVDAALYLLKADFVTGETIIVDGGRHAR
ncbi:MAG TPA: SDR family oxidoreductase [Gemmatimonadaceae bacterium]|nr:SDR family oxidoreductase [Gemmatimonadaceae bacterium]